MKMSNEIRNNALTSFLNPKEIVSVAVTNHDVMDSLTIPKSKTMTYAVIRIRKIDKKDTMYVFQDIPESLKFGLVKNRFVQYDSGKKDKNRYIICYNTSQDYLLKGSRKWIADGTFKIVSNPFKQLYIVQCVVVNQPSLFLTYFSLERMKHCILKLLVN
ncbi:hypothetical protein NGRA_2838 [Nosema granulosis]|uniref:Uncharacterized protein n=1 Tax=Nosema granulosis TaxID=83296 RepID=A0A9P6GVW6_9MICR|nr:hypothetical protein NGRA_2838 [Nosema granulosis]